MRCLPCLPKPPCLLPQVCCCASRLRCRAQVGGQVGLLAPNRRAPLLLPLLVPRQPRRHRCFESGKRDPLPAIRLGGLRVHFGTRVSSVQSGILYTVASPQASHPASTAAPRCRCTLGPVMALCFGRPSPITRHQSPIAIAIAVAIARPWLRRQREARRRHAHCRCVRARLRAFMHACICTDARCVRDICPHPSLGTRPCPARCVYDGSTSVQQGLDIHQACSRPGPGQASPLLLACGCAVSRPRPSREHTCFPPIAASQASTSIKMRRRNER